MEKIKIYLSRSKQCRVDDVARVRGILQKYDDVELVEFLGGTYKPEIIDDCDIILFLTPGQYSNNSVSVGKGQYTEYERAVDKKICKYCICGNNPKTWSIYLQNFSGSINALEIDWKTKWAELFLIGSSTNLREAIDDFIDWDTDDSWDVNVKTKPTEVLTKDVLDRIKNKDTSPYEKVNKSYQALKRTTRINTTTPMLACRKLFKK